MSDLIAYENPFLPAVKSRAEELVQNSRALSTRRMYRVQFEKFARFCESKNVPAVPASPEILAEYIVKLTDSKVSASTLSQTVAAIKTAHKLKRFSSPTDDPAIKEILRGARREIGLSVHKKAAVNPDILRNMISCLNLETLKGLRDRAILLLGFAGAFRRSELVALNFEDFEAVTDRAGRRAYIVTVRKSKTDQFSRGMEKAIFSASEKMLDPVRAIEEYFERAAIKSGAIFRPCLRGNKISSSRLSDYAVALIVKTAAHKAGVALDLAGHSLRSGFVTSAMRSGASERSIMNQTGHKSISVMRGYQRRVNAMQDNAASKIL